MIVFRSEIENCNPVGGEEAASGITFVGLLVGRKNEAGVLSGEAGLECFRGRRDKGWESDNRVSEEVQTRRRKGLEVFFWVGED